MSGFSNAVVGGAQKLIRAAIQSPNFLTGISGWIIRKNGTAEFSSGIFRGTITASSFAGTDFILNQNGLFIYTGTPAAGNLFVSIAPLAGANDGFTNAYKAGIQIQGVGDAGQSILFTLIGNLAELVFPSSASFEGTASNLFTGLVGSGGTQVIQTGLSGPKGNVVGSLDWTQLQLVSANQGGTQTAVAALNYIDTLQAIHSLLVWGASGLLMNTLGGLGLRVSGAALADTATRSNTTAGLVQISQGWTIPANDMVAGATYKVHIYGNGTQGTTQQTLQFEFVIGGINTSLTFPATFAPISGAFRWHTTITIVCKTNGATGTVFLHGEVIVTAVNFVAVNSDALNVMGSGTQILDTTAANIIALFSAWGSTTGAPTMAGQFSWLERIA
jgi:hypothetical protein